jgi:putative ABC transport system permease protein
MRAIDRKLLRDLRGMWGQALAIAFVIVSGVATFVAMTATMDSLQSTLAAYYDDYRFADAFTSVRRAPERLHERLRQVPGVGLVQTRVVAAVNLEVPGFDEPVTGQIVSIPESGEQPVLNRLFVRSGRLVRPGREDEVVLNEVFAEAHNLGPGSTLTAILNGRRKTLTVVGIALSPEFLMQIQPGSLFPDPQRFGVMWMGRAALAAAYDMEGAFNNATFALAPGADVRDVVERLDTLLKPYGSLGVQARKDQPSHFYITEEFRQLRTMATVLPAIFLAVAAFLLNIVVTRLIGTQREQIAVLKAFGYANRDVGWHYLKFVLVIVCLGVAGGTALGLWLGRGYARLYMEFYRFPYLEYTLRLPVFFAAIALTTAAALAGVVQAVRRAAQLPPAEAMRPAPPAAYRPTFVERLGLQRLFDQPTRMIARNLERQPVKALLTVTGMAAACAILIMGLFFSDAFDYIVDVQYGMAERADLTVTFTEPASTAALYEVQALRGVHFAEPFRAVPVRLKHGHRVYETGISGVPDRPYLRRLFDRQLRPVPIPTEGLVLTDRLAAKLGVEAGDEVIVEVLEGSRRTVRVPVAALAQQYFGLGAYMNLDRLNRLSGSGQAYSGLLLTVDTRYEAELVRALQRRPRVASIVSQDRIIQSVYETSGQTMLTFAFILTLFAGAIAFGVVYNSARIALAERDRELASLRVLGFTRNEIAYILLGELAVLTLLSLPVGFGLGALLSAAFVESMTTDLYEMPLILGRGTFAYAAVVVLAAATISALIVRRKLNTLDLVGVLKTRE